MSEADEQQAAVARAQAIKRAYQEQLMAKANVVGVGIGLREVKKVRTNKVALVVMVSRKLPRSSLAPEDVIPDEIEGVPVDVQETGTFHAL